MAAGRVSIQSPPRSRTIVPLGKAAARLPNEVITTWEEMVVRDEATGSGPTTGCRSDVNGSGG